MFPFYNTQTSFPPFWGAGFPFFFGRRRRRLNTISGIPVLRTTGVVATSTEVRYDVNYADYRSLPNEGLFFLDVRQASPTASASLPVGLSDSESDNTTQSLLRNALQEDVQAGDLQVNFRYLIYYNKCNNTYQLVEDPRIKELQDEVNELKNIIKQASSMVPPPMKQMLPQNMQNVMKEVDQ